MDRGLVTVDSFFTKKNNKILFGCKRGNSIFIFES
jgi:hypothetical protein